MGSLTEERSQTMILRAWVEADDEHRLRVRVIRLRPDRAGEPEIGAAATIDGVCMLVRAWLEELISDADCGQAEPRPGGSGLTPA
jgi:hypothetical protein